MEILNLVPVALWIADMSAVKRSIDHFRKAGVVDLREHLDPRPQDVLAIIGTIRIVWANDALLEVFEAADRVRFPSDPISLFGKGSYVFLKEHIFALAEGRAEYVREAVLTLPRGEQKRFLLNSKVDCSRAGSLARVLVSLTDITSLEAAEELLRNSEMLYRQAFEASTVPMMIVDAASEIILDANAALLQLLNFPRQQLQGAGVARLCPDGRTSPGAEKLAGLVSGKKPLTGSLLLDRADGSTINVAAAARTIRSGERPCAVLAFSAAESPMVPWERRTKADRRSPAAAMAKLTDRERLVLTLIAMGRTNKSIGEQLGISRKTVETHRQRLMQKLDVHKATDLVRQALAAGLLS